MNLFKKIILLIFAVFIFLMKNVTIQGDGVCNVRKASFAGIFYPKDKITLNIMVNKYLKSANKIDLKNCTSIVGFISPHAGYIYSGQVAAYVYKQIKNQKVDLIVIFGNSHHFYYEGASLGFFKYYETPLGLISVEFKTVKDLLQKKSNMLHFFAKAHISEHCIEVQIPFIQKVKKDVKILPFGNGNFENVKKVVDLIWEEVKGRNVIFLASTDLSHYHTYEEALKLDNFTIETISKLNTNLFEESYKKKKIELCAPCAVYALIYLAEKIGHCKFVKLKYSNSGDVPNGRKDSVVGYLAGMITTTTNGE